MSEKERMLSGNLYMPYDEELIADRKKSRMITRLFNTTTEEQKDYRKRLLKDLFEKTGDKLSVEPPFRCDYGCNISVGNNFYANYDCIILDVCKVDIGDNVFFAPRVCIYTAGHPIDAEIRNVGLEFGKPVKIGNNVWVGGSTVINPGVTIGDNVVIGSGSVVTKDIPDNVIAVGNPCKVLRKITEEDRIYWQKQKEEYYNDLHI
ncbi:sugar O-acetyltransferase [Clostridium sp.]|uniref:sugar O-acetyltransferase n=1 Tax=Clostridium sp. TaxID=1506 RepID=UPI0025B9CB5C|nr:sugar O-acetyltransferase [Clostridium sp.]